MMKRKDQGRINQNHSEGQALLKAELNAAKPEPVPIEQSNDDFPKPSDSHPGSMLRSIVRKYLGSGKTKTAKRILVNLIRDKSVIAEHAAAELIRIYSKERDFGSVEQIVEHAKKEGICDKIIINAAISAYLRNQDANAATRLLGSPGTGFNSNDTNIILKNLEQKHVDAVKVFFNGARLQGLVDSKTFHLMATMYQKSGMWKDAIDVFRMAVADDMVDKFLLNQVLTSLKDNGRIKEAQEVYGIAVALDLVDDHINTTMIDAYCKCGMMAEAQGLFESAYQGTVPAHIYSAMILGYMKNDDSKKAEELFHEAVERGVADVRIFTIMVKGMGIRKSIRDARKYFDIAVDRNIVDGILCITMIHLYGSYGQTDNVVEIFDKACKNLIDPKLFSGTINTCPTTGDYVRKKLVEFYQEGKISKDDILMIFDDLHKYKRFADIVLIMQALPQSAKSPDIIRKYEHVMGKPEDSSQDSRP
jgi:pentatricopeptide repeat protein